MIGSGKPLYSIDRQIINTGEPFGDEAHILYVNGENKDVSTELGKLMHDFFCTNPDEMHYKELAKKTRYFKEDEKGVSTMCKALEDMRNETAERERIKSALSMLKIGKMTIEEIAECSRLSLDKVKELAAPYGLKTV